MINFLYLGLSVFFALSSAGLVLLTLRRKREAEYTANFQEFLDSNGTVRPRTRVTIPLQLKQTKVDEEFEKAEKALAEARDQIILAKANAIGPRLHMIGAVLPHEEKWRIEEMMNHRNELRAEGGRVPLFHYVRLFLAALEIRWEARAYPERRIE